MMKFGNQIHFQDFFEEKIAECFNIKSVIQFSFALHFLCPH